MTLSPRQLIIALVVLAAGLVAGLLYPPASTALFAIGAVGAIGALLAGSPGAGKAFTDLPDALARAARGERPALPPNASPDISRVYDSAGQIAEQVRREHEAAEAQADELQAVQDALRDIAQGKQPQLPAKASPQARKLFDQLELVAASVLSTEDADEAREAMRALMPAVQQPEEMLAESAARRVQHVAEASSTTREVSSAVKEMGQHVEVLTSSAEEASTILDMISINQQVGESIADLASNVRETASSIEEMAYSIKEVAKNVDQLSLTAEETSSAMNEMDIAIDQVRSNAMETARLSEEVAQDAERGAEAILKTIGEIYRIKESTQEAVSVISNLGSRIEAIGQILNVIDDVAEQTNLLALNAAIIAAQAGEHGKGFAVVADEIKDLAERAGASTKEIAELTKTIQNESKNAIAAVERGAKNVDRGVEVSNDAERALKKILESSQKSTNMVRAIARATEEQAKGSKQVTDAIGRIAEMVQQIASATGEQARGSELIMKSVEKMRAITQNVERSSQEQGRGGRQVTQAIENISGAVEQLNRWTRSLQRAAESLTALCSRAEQSAREDEGAIKQLSSGIDKLRAASDGRR